MHAAASTAGHVVLLGDSIFDNKRYVGRDPDVVAQVRNHLPGGWQATLLAVDGDVTGGVARQLRALPGDATHLVVSVGGNDALGFAHLLEQPAATVAGGLLILERAQRAFSRNYEAMLDGVASRGLPAAVCTIYDTPTSAPTHAVLRTGIAIFNDAITRAAFRRAVPLLDLRLICQEDEDYANPIEPSARGGDKIAAAIAEWAAGPGDAARSVVVAGGRP